MKTTSIIFGLITIIALNGCAPKKTFYKANGDWNKDFKSCQYEAVKHTTGYNIYNDRFGFQEVMKQNQIIEMCLYDKGWELQTQNHSEQ